MTSPPMHTSEKTKRELKQVSGPKRKLIEVAQQLKYIDRVPLYGVDCRVFERYDDSMFVSVSPDAEFREVWSEITELMGIIAPVETTEEVDVCDVDEVQFYAVASGSQTQLKAWYRADGSLRVVASWAYDSRSLMAQVLLDKIYTLD